MPRVALFLLAAFMMEAEATERSHKARADFIRLNPCPATGSNKPHYACKGWVVDHIVPLACNGLDHHSNMQWQTVAEAKAKDKRERKGCAPK
ncbi:MAG TPA: HNH endonuclease [Methylophilaceae bacterium]|nr:HNH endonuclease [Methylophilaceae bacterium]